MSESDSHRVIAASEESVAPRASESRSWWGVLLANRHWGPVVGGMLLLVVVVLVLLVPVLTPFDPIAMSPSDRLLPPGAPNHPLGTDHFGRDILSRLASGGRLSLLVGLAPIALAICFGLPLGLSAGFFGGWVDHLLSRLMELFLAFPSILLAIGIVAALGPGLLNAILAITFTEIPVAYRIVRGPVLSLREREFVLAARVIGAADARILVTHILPNVLPPLVVFASVGVGSMIIFGSGLSFIGLGAQPPQAEWGLMLAEGRFTIAVAPHEATVPGLVILVVVLAFNLIGDGLRDLLDPRSRGSVA